VSEEMRPDDGHDAGHDANTGPGERQAHPAGRDGAKREAADGKTPNRGNGSGAAPTGPDPDTDRTMTGEERKSLLLISLFLASLVLTASVAIAFLAVDEEKEEPEIMINNVFTQRISSDNDSYTFDMIVLITNRAESRARDMRIDIVGIDNTAKLTYDKNSASGFEIPAETTREISIRLTVARAAAHKMYVMVFSENILKLKGYAVVSDEGHYSQRDFRVTYEREYTGTAKFPEVVCFMAPLFVLLLILEGIVIMFSIRREVFLSALRKCRPGTR